MGKRHKNKHNSSIKKQSTYDTACVDLHIHTVRSLDGELSVDKILKDAVSNNVRYLSITDHNNLDGSKKALRFVAENPNKYPNLKIIPGVEISCCDDNTGAKFHLLVYDFDVNNKALNDKLQEIRKQERQVYYAIFSILEKNFNITFSPYEIIKASATHSDITWDAVGEMAVLHLDENGNPAPYALTPSEFVATIKKAIQANQEFVNIQDKLMLDIKYFGNRDIKETKYPSLDEILPLIKAAGGVPVLAHPKNISFGYDNMTTGSSSENYKKKIEQFIEHFKNKTASLKMDAGMEVFFAAQHNEETYYSKLAQQNNLLISGGSDFHGPHKNLNHRIGTVANRYKIVKLPLLSYLINDRKKEYITENIKVDDCIYKINKKSKKTYKAKNANILDDNGLKKASQLNIVVNQFGSSPMVVHSIHDKTIQMKHRNNLVKFEEAFNKLIKNDETVLKEAFQTKEKCLDNIIALHDNYSEYRFLLQNYKDSKKEVENFDNLENKEKFVAHINKTLTIMEFKYKQAMSVRDKMYNSFMINAKNAYKQVILEKQSKKTEEKTNQILEL